MFDLTNCQIGHSSQIDQSKDTCRHSSPWPLVKKCMSFNKKYMSFSKKDPSIQLGQFEKIGILVVAMKNTNEKWASMEQAKASYEKTIKTLQHNVIKIQHVFYKGHKSLELYYSNNILQQYDELTMQYIILRIKYNYMEITTIEVNTWQNLV